MYNIHSTSGIQKRNLFSEPVMMARRYMVGGAFLVEGGMLAVALLLGCLLDIAILPLLAPSPLALVLMVPLTIPMMGFLVAAYKLKFKAFTRLRELLEEEFAQLFQSCTNFDLFVIALLAGLGEEALFRGIAQTLLAGYLGPWTGLVLASLLFGFCHPFSKTYISIATLMGLYLGALYQWTGSLALPVGIHALYDFAALLYIVRLRKGVRPA
ncbi:MAG: CPBP family intramembrane metalloprotease [Candidatus Hydrogenedentes bacterium]|nr:CPBP family intramembrane metalloprotease [Candidatus Hydrogenedentota bacterium]